MTSAGSQLTPHNRFQGKPHHTLTRLRDGGAQSLSPPTRGSALPTAQVKEIKEFPSKWKGVTYLGAGRLSVVKIAMLPKLICECHTILSNAQCPFYFILFFHRN